MASPRIEGERYKLNISRFNIVELAQDIVDTFEPKSQQSQHHTSSEKPE